MFGSERRRLLLDLVRINGAVSLRDLARAVHASDVTVRRDLRSLEADGLLARQRGGAVICDGPPHDALERRTTNTPATAKGTTARIAIAQAAAATVSQGDAIAIGPGTTAQQLARYLVGFHSLTVVTTSLLVAEALARASGVEVFLTAGSLHRSTSALVGPLVTTSLTGLRLDRVFLSGDGLSVERGLSARNMLSASADRAIAETAENITVLADHTIMSIDRMFETLPMARISSIVTDSHTNEAVVGTLRDRGVVVIVAKSRRPDGTR